jgi:predicted DNA repair protein MutK
VLVIIIRSLISTILMIGTLLRLLLAGNQVTEAVKPLKLIEHQLFDREQAIGYLVVVRYRVDGACICGYQQTAATGRTCVVLGWGR